MTLNQGVFLFFAALAGGTLNSVAGGGGFIAFPALIFTGMPPINANATNTMALWPGTVASTSAYRNAFNHEVKPLMLPLVVTGLTGGLAGAIFLLKTPQATFMRMVPWLLLGATLLFTFSGKITGFVRSRTTSTVSPGSPAAKAAAALFQLVIALYIGFFGAGAGIMMLAMFALLGIKNIHAMNGLKAMMASVCNAVALVTFIAARAIYWPQALLMLVGAIMGGYWGAYFAQKVRPQVIRYLVIATGAFMSTYFFVRY